MTVGPEAIADLVRHALPDSEVSIDDIRGDRLVYNLYIASSVFKNKSVVDQHRLVYSALKSLEDECLESLSIRTEAL